MDVTKILTEKLIQKDFGAREEALHEVCNLIVNDMMSAEGKILILDYSLTTIFTNVGLNHENYVRAVNLDIIQCILEDNLSKGYLSEEKLEEVYTKMIEYTALEDVNYGYDKVLGMIHTLAHIADVFTTLFMYKNFCNADRFKIYFELITRKYCSKDYVFVTDEAARIFRIFNFYFINASNVDYVLEFLEEVKTTFAKGFEGLYQRQNYYNYLHTLNYFTNDMELLRFIVAQLEAKYKRYINEVL